MHLRTSAVLRFISFILVLFIGFNVILHYQINSLLESSNVLHDDKVQHDFISVTNEGGVNGVGDYIETIGGDVKSLESSFSSNIPDRPTSTDDDMVEDSCDQTEGNESGVERNPKSLAINIDMSTRNESIISNEKVLTGAWIYRFWAGFCNQYFMFIGIVFLSNELGNEINREMSQKYQIDNEIMLDYQSNQIYIHSLQWKDLYGTNNFLRHEVLFDVHHWNKFYPRLPKLVSTFDTDGGTKQNKESSLPSSKFTDVFIHYDERGSPESIVATKEKTESYLGLAPRMIWNKTTLSLEKTTNGERMLNATNPYPMGLKSTQSANNRYKEFTKRLHRYNMKKMTKVTYKHRMEMQQYKLILRDAFRPHPELQAIIDDFKESLQSENKSNLHNQTSTRRKKSKCTTSSISTTKYMVLHARIEPDMQKHPMCKEKKVTNITHIINALYETFPNPPATKMIILLNKQILEEEVNDIKSNNKMAEYNLRILEDILQNGLWDGQTDVIEAGSKLATETNHKIYSKHSTLVGGIINFFLSIDAYLFIGTEISSYSTSVVNSRYYRYNDGNEEMRINNFHKSYFYEPNGLQLKDSIHWFQC